jgi:predicted acyl esterase
MRFMRIVESLPWGVREIEHVWIPVGGGVRLSARLWLPEGAPPVPAVLEYIPYRKRDDTRWRDEPMHGYFAGHGYASVRIDVRGCGTSDGVLTDEYSEAEWADGLEALRWIAAQPWCDGRIGLLGRKPLPRNRPQIDGNIGQPYFHSRVPLYTTG